MSAKRFTYSLLLFVVGATNLGLISSCGGDKNVNAPAPIPVPALVVSVNGNYFKAVMGDTAVDRPLNFAVRDTLNHNLAGQWIFFNLLDGDGALSADSLRTNSTGITHLTYSFNGVKGSATIQYILKNKDTAEIDLRANTVIPGVDGQAQYILFTDLYTDVKNYNGIPASEDEDPTFWVNYANYELSKHVVFVINDVNQDHHPQNAEDVLAIILTLGNPSKTKDSIGIGSTYHEIKAAYGAPDSVYYDPAPPPAIAVEYKSLGMLFFIDTVTGTPVDTNKAAFEIHLDDFITAPVTGKISEKNVLTATESPLNYRRFRK